MRRLGASLLAMAVGLALGCAGELGSPLPDGTVADDGPVNNDPGANEGIEDYDADQANLVDRYVLARLARLGIEPNWATEPELIRRMSIDLTGVVPSDADISAVAGGTPEAMADYFMDQPGYIMVSQVVYADMLAYSNDEMFSRSPQIAELNQMVADLHAGTLAYDAFAQQALMQPAYLSRFTSAADRATAALIVFIGYEPVTPYDYEFSNMFRGYELTDETERIFTWTGDCDDPETDTEIETCDAQMWGMTGSNPTEAGEMMVSTHAFAEHGASLIWRRYIGADVSAEMPELAVALGDMFAETEFNLRAVTKEIVTSAAYRQSYNYRDEELVID